MSLEASSEPWTAGTTGPLLLLLGVGLQAVVGLAFGGIERCGGPTAPLGLVTGLAFAAGSFSSCFTDPLDNWTTSGPGHFGAATRTTVLEVGSAAKVVAAGIEGAVDGLGCSPGPPSIWDWLMDKNAAAVGFATAGK